MFFEMGGRGCYCAHLLVEARVGRSSYLRSHFEACRKTIERKLGTMLKKVGRQLVSLGWGGSGSGSDSDSDSDSGLPLRRRCSLLSSAWHFSTESFPRKSNSQAFSKHRFYWLVKLKLRFSPSVHGVVVMKTRLPTIHHESLNYRAGLVQFGSWLTGS